MTDERAIELLCEMVNELLCEMLTNCEMDISSGYVDTFRKEKALALDIAIEAIKEKMERETDNPCVSCKYGIYSSCDGSCPLTN
jgi:hypothetical protein